MGDFHTTSMCRFMVATQAALWPLATAPAATRHRRMQKIGAYRFPDRKKPCLCVEKGNTCTVYGSFIDTDRANEFMNELAALVGARDDKERLE